MLNLEIIEVGQIQESFARNMLLAVNEFFVEKEGKSIFYPDLVEALSKKAEISKEFSAGSISVLVELGFIEYGRLMPSGNGHKIRQVLITQKGEDKIKELLK